MSLQPPLEGLSAYRLPDRARMVQALADLRREWQETLTGMSLLDAPAPVGLLLSDIADRLGLSSQERHVMLGGKLINEVNAFMEQCITLALE